MSEIASGYVSLLPSAKGFGSKLQSQVGAETDGAGKRLGSGFGKAFAAGAAIIAAAGIGSFVKGAIGDASDLSESQSKVGVVFGKSAAQIMKASQTSATAMGLTKGAYLDATGTLGNLLVSLDIGPKKAAGLSQSMVKLAGDMASFNNTSPEEALDALKSGLTGETEPLKRFGVNMNDATLKAQALKMGLVASTKEALDPQTKALAAQALIMAQTKTAQGDFARTSGGLANQQRILTAQFGNLKATIGGALLPVVTKFVTFLTSTALPAIAGLGPVFGQVKAFVAPFVASIASLFSGGASGGILAGFTSLSATIQANFLPVLQQMATTFQTVILPAVTSFVTYIATALVPIFRTVAGIITGQVVPILASLATFFYGTLYPAIFQIVTAVASNLKPVFDQLVSTFQSRVLPAVQNLLVKFREWQPTIQLVVLAIVKVVGKVLEFAAAILGKVLPVAIRFAGFLIGTLVGAIIGAVSACIKIIQVVIKVGQQFNEGAKQIDAFVRAALSKVGDFLSFMGKLPGKIKAVFSGAATFLVSAGQDIIRGLINGIKSMAGAAADAAKAAVKGALDGAKSLLGIHSPSTKFAEVGKFSMLGYKKGVDDNADKVRDAMIAALKKSLDAMTAHRDKIKSVVDQIKSDMASLADSVKGAFTGGLFDVSAIAESLTETTFTAAQSVGTAFQWNLSDKKAELTHLLAAFKKLKKWGLPAGFLSQLFASGNSALILEMAAGGKGAALQDAKLFGEVDSLSQQLGGAVAQNDYGPELRKQTNKLHDIEKAVKRVGADLAHALDRKAADAQRKGGKK